MSEIASLFVKLGFRIDGLNEAKEVLKTTQAIKEASESAGKATARKATSEETAAKAQEKRLKKEDSEKRAKENRETKAQEAKVKAEQKAAESQVKERARIEQKEARRKTDTLRQIESEKEDLAAEATKTQEKDARDLAARERAWDSVLAKDEIKAQDAAAKAQEDEARNQAEAAEQLIRDKEREERAAKRAEEASKRAMHTLAHGSARAAAGMGALVAAFAAVAKIAGEVSTRIADFSTLTGLSPTEFQKGEFQAKQAGVAEDYAAQLKAFQLTAGQVKLGMTEMPIGWANLGISPSDDPNTMFEKARKAISSAPTVDLARPMATNAGISDAMFTFMRRKESAFGAMPAHMIQNKETVEAGREMSRAWIELLEIIKAVGGVIMRNLYSPLTLVAEVLSVVITAFSWLFDLMMKIPGAKFLFKAGVAVIVASFAALSVAALALASTMTAIMWGLQVQGALKTLGGAGKAGSLARGATTAAGGLGEAVGTAGWIIALKSIGPKLVSWGSLIIGILGTLWVALDTALLGIVEALTLFAGSAVAVGASVAAILATIAAFWPSIHDWINSFGWVKKTDAILGEKTENMGSWSEWWNGKGGAKGNLESTLPTGNASAVSNNVLTYNPNIVVNASGGADGKQIGGEVSKAIDSSRFGKLFNDAARQYPTAFFSQAEARP